MPSYTTSLRLVQPATGEYSGTWGTQVNNGITALVDTSVAGTATITMTAADYTLSTANGATDEARAMFLVLKGTPGASFNVICPAVSKLYFVVNNTGFAQTIKTSASAGVSVPNGARMAVYYNPELTPSPDFVGALNYFGSLTLGAALPIASGGTGSTSTAYCSLTTNVTGILPTANGGTGLAAFTSNRILYASSTSVINQSAGLTFDGTNFATTGNSTGAKFIPTGGAVGGNGMYLPAANTIGFSTDSTQRVQITSAGYLKASNNGTYQYSAVNTHEFNNNNAGTAVGSFYASNATYAGSVVSANTTRAANPNFILYDGLANGIQQFFVTGDGEIYAQNTTVQSLSDGRLKENIRNATEGLSVITSLRPVRYDWKSGHGNDKKNQLGFIAQEVEAVFPDAVSTWKNTDNPADPYKTVGPGALIPVLVKAIQELAAEVERLKQR